MSEDADANWPMNQDHEHGRRGGAPEDDEEEQRLSARRKARHHDDDAEEEEVKVEAGAWVRIKRGKYQGDLAQVVDTTENGEEVGLKFIPRIDLNTKDDVGGPNVAGKKRKKMGSGLSVSTRPPQRFFNVEEVTKVYGRKSVDVRAMGLVYVFQNDTFKDGYIEKDIRLSGIQTEDVNPTWDELTKFVKQQDGEEGEV